MHIDLPEETKALRDELRAYLTTIMTPELAEELRHLDAGAGGEEHAKALEKIAADGWLGMGWPKEFGGQGRSAIDQYVFFEEFQRVAAVAVQFVDEADDRRCAQPANIHEFDRTDLYAAGSVNDH